MKDAKCLRRQKTLGGVAFFDAFRKGRYIYLCVVVWYDLLPTHRMANPTLLLTS
jgi:hypothetical protein